MALRITYDRNIEKEQNTMNVDPEDDGVNIGSVDKYVSLYQMD